MIIFRAAAQAARGGVDLEEDAIDPERPVMNAQELLHHTFPWETAPGIPAVDGHPSIDAAAPRPPISRCV